LIIFRLSKNFIYILIIVQKKFCHRQPEGVMLTRHSNDISEIMSSNFHNFVTGNFKLLAV
jgi:hypothetical protein